MRHTRAIRSVKYQQHDAHVATGLSGSAGESQPVRRVLVFTIVALALMMMSIDLTIVATALLSLQQGLHTSINWAGWTITAYSFGFVLMLPISGKLSERYGRRRVFIGSVIAFTVASLFCGLADNIFVLIALRVVQAAGGAGFTPSATGIVVDYFGDARDRAVSLFGSIFPVGAMIGPVFGGLFVSYWSWRAVFFVNVPIGLAIIVLALRYIPRDRPRAEQHHAGAGAVIALLREPFLGEAACLGYVPRHQLLIVEHLVGRHLALPCQPRIDRGVGPDIGAGRGRLQPALGKDQVRPLHQIVAGHQDETFGQGRA